MIERLLSPTLIDALGWTLLHTLWQGALFAVLLGLALIALRAYSAQARYLVAVGFLAAFFLTVGLTFVGLYSSAPPTAALPETTRITNENPSSAKPASASIEVVSNTQSPATYPIAESWQQRATNYFDRHLPLIVTLWLLGVLFLQLRFLGQLVYIQRLKSYATERLPPRWAARIQELEARMDIHRPVRYLTSHRVSGPFTTGWLRPVVMLPHELLLRLRDIQLVAILAHELAHVKRHDFAVNLLQTALSTFFFYHPGVWWISARIHDEREHCCDDLAIQATGERVDYARTLVELQERELTAPKLAMAYGGGGFGYRIRRLLTGYLGTATFGEGVVTTLIFVAVGSLALAATGSSQPTPSDGYPSDGVPGIVAPAPPPPAPAPPPPPPAAPPPPPTEQSVEETFDFHVDVHEDGQQDTNPATDEFDLLMRNIYDGKVEMVRYLLDKVDDLNRLDERGFTPLMAAASENEIEITRLLLDRGVDVNQLNDNGWTALTEAADEGSLAVARLLIEAGAGRESEGLPDRYPPDHGRLGGSPRRAPAASRQWCRRQCR